LTADEAEAIEKHGLHTLSDFLPKKPSDVELKVIKEMFEASVDGQPYDPEKWGAYYKPYGLKVEGGSSDSAERSAPVARPAPAPVAQDDDAPFDVDEPTPVAATAPVQAKPASTQKAEDILAMIRNKTRQ
jgi:hypothetical protein